MEITPRVSIQEDSARLSEKVYDWIRSAIVRGGIRPNQRLVELDLAAELRVSRTPVRDALRRLEAEGLVATRRREWIVRDYSKADISEMYELRVGLELLATRLAANKASESELDTLVAMAASHPLGEIGNLPPEEWLTINNRFHYAVADAAHNSRLFEALRVNNEQYFNYQIARLYVGDELRESFAEHAAIAAAMRARDGNKAATVMERHVTKALDMLLAKLV